MATSPFPQVDYTQMIMSAIEELDPKEGVNIRAISSYIETNYPDLPPAHPTLLSTALNKMRHSGQLLFANDNFFLPDPSAPPKRGRGRPPKPRSGSPPVPSYTGPPRPRGRPPKVVDPLAPPPLSMKKKTPPSPSGRPRGRPRKDDVVSAPAPVVASVPGVKRGRGRPPKTATY